MVSIGGAKRLTAMKVFFDFNILIFPLNSIFRKFISVDQSPETSGLIRGSFALANARQGSIQKYSDAGLF